MILFEANFNDTSFWHHACKKYPTIGDPSELEVGNIFVPGEFDHVFFKEGLPVEHDPSNQVGWTQPEGHHESVAQFPKRVYEGFAAWMMFGFFKIIDGGASASINVPQKGKLTISMAAHAWSSTDDDANTSNDVGSAAFNRPEGSPELTDAQRNITFWVGVGDDPYNAWLSEGLHIYNTYDVVLGQFEVEAGEIDVFFRAKALWPFKHNNVYFDRFLVTFEADETPPEECKGLPREQFERTYLLLHPQADTEWMQAAIDSGLWDAKRVTMGGSADDAGLGDLAYRRVLAVNPTTWPGDLEEFYRTYYPGTQYIPIEAETPTDLKGWLENWLNPTQPPNGGSHLPLAPGLHLNTGDSGASDWYKLLAVDLDPETVAPSVKAYGTGATMATLKLFKDIDGRILTVGRLSIGCDPNVNVEGPNLSGDLLAEAQRVMNSSMCAWNPHRAYVDVWEIINEQDPVGIEGHLRLATFMQHCMDIADANGYKVALFSYSLGVPEWDEMAAIAATGILAEAKRRGHYIALHEYDFPLDNGFGDPIPGRDARPDRGSIAFRYRWWEDAVGGAENMPNVLLTEVNVACELPTLPASEWDSQVRWYMEEASKDAYVKAVHLFGWGSLGGAWQDYDIQYAGLAPYWYQMVLDYQGELPPELLHFTYPTTHLPALITSPYGPRDTIFHYGIDLRSSWGAWKDELVAAIDGTVILTGIEVGREYFGQQVQIAMQHGDDTVVVRYAHMVPEASGGIYVRVGDTVKRGTLLGRPDNTGVSSADHLHFDVRVNGPYAYIDPTDLIDWPEEQTAIPLIGINDPDNTGAGHWMVGEGVKGLLVIPLFIGDSARILDYRTFANAGIQVIVNLRYSWSVDLGGAGTLPIPGSTEWNAFVAAAAQTINNAQGVWGFELLNEANNPREWPQGTVITPQNVADTYNAIYRRVTTDKRNLSPGALDPFNAAAGDPRAWLAQTYTAIDGCQFVAAHGYIRGHEPSLVISTDQFTDAPLLWQYRNYYRCVSALLESLPDAYRTLPIYITEFAPIEIDPLWLKDPLIAQTVLATHAVAQTQHFAGIALYRWQGDPWHLYDNSFVLEAIKQIAS